MEERVHVSSWPIGRDFTFSEWCDYLKAHPNSSSEPVAEFDGWKFNVHGVCVNRATPVKVQAGGATFDVQLYKAPRGRKLGEPLTWNWSGWYDTGQGGGTLRGGEVKGDEREAILAGLRDVVRMYEGNFDYYKNNPSQQAVCRRMVARAQQEIENRTQLSLFD